MTGHPATDLLARCRQAAAPAARLARYWRSSVGVLLLLTCIGLAFAYGLPAVYEATAQLEVGAGARSPRGPSVAEDVTALLEDRSRLQKLLHDSPTQSPLATVPLDVLVTSVGVTAASERTISLVYRAGHAEVARSGCAALADLVVAYFSKGSRDTARAALEQHTKELADFVNAHPDVLLEGASSAAHPGPRPPASSSDVALNVLKTQKARLEAELAEVRAAAAEPAKANPYDEAVAAPNVADLERRLADVKYAIAARQRAAAASPPGAPSVTPAAPNQLALQAEWRRLVLSVVDAEPASASLQSAGSVKILRAPALPDRPVKPNRRFFIVIGFLSGIWLAVLAALMQLVRDDRRQQRARQRRTRSDRPPRAAAGGSDPPRAAAGGSDPPRAAAGGSDPPRAALSPGPPQPSDALTLAQPPAAGAPEPRQLPPANPAHDALKSGPETRIGMMDPALMRTQIGGTPAGLLSRPQPMKAVGGVDAIPARAPGAEVGPPGTQRFGGRPSSDPPKGLAGTRRSASDAPRGLAPNERSSSDPAHARRAHGAGEDEGPAGTQRIPLDDAGGLAFTQRSSSNPPRAPRPSSDRPGASENPNARASRIPMPGGAPNTADLFTPPPVLPRPPATGVDFSPVPDTQRFGSLDESAGEPKTLSPPPPPPSRSMRDDRPDTKYSFVDRARHSRPPVAERPAAGSAPPPGQSPVNRSQRPVVGEGAGRGSVRPAAVNRREAKPAAGASMSPPVVEGEVWEKVSQPRPTNDDLITARPAPPSWRLSPTKEGAGNGVLSGLRDQIFDLAKRAPFVLGVTSEYNSLESKTLVAARLSTMLSEDGRVRVLLLEANFDFPGVHRVLAIEMPPGAGFSQQLRARLRGGGTKKPWSVVRCTDRLDVLAEGLVRSPGVLLSQEFADAVAELRRCYDVIVIDSPIAGLGIETKPIDSVSDGIAIVASTTSTLRDALERGMKWFGQKKLMVAVPADAGAP